MMKVIFVLNSNKAFSDVLENVTSKNFSFAPLACLIPSFLCVTSALNFLVMQFTILQVSTEKNVANCAFYHNVSPKRNTRDLTAPNSRRQQ